MGCCSSGTGHSVSDGVLLPFLNEDKGGILGVGLLWWWWLRWWNLSSVSGKKLGVEGWKRRGGSFGDEQ